MFVLEVSYSPLRYNVMVGMELRCLNSPSLEWYCSKSAKSQIKTWQIFLSLHAYMWFVQTVTTNILNCKPSTAASLWLASGVHIRMELLVSRNISMVSTTISNIYTLRVPTDFVYKGPWFSHDHRLFSMFDISHFVSEKYIIFSKHLHQRNSTFYFR